MRRNEKEVKDRLEIIKILDNSDVLRIAMIDYKYPYIVPLNFATSINEEDNICLISHSAAEGKKIDLLRINNRVCFETDIFYKISDHNSDIPCQWSSVYESVIGSGRIKIITEDSEKIKGLEQIMNKYGKGRSFQSFDPEAISRVVILRLDVENISGKRQLS